MTYSRASPSPHYERMIKLYQTMHTQGEKQLGLMPDETYPGIYALRHAVHIKELIDESGARTLLDYGSGKGYQYDLPKVTIPGAGEWDSLIDYWDVDEVRCFDPCYAPFSKFPEGNFDGVISTDVLEHCTAEDIPWIVTEMFSLARLFVFVTVACYPAKSTLPNGENAHTTIRPAEWWKTIFANAASIYSGVHWKLLVEK